MQRAHSSPAASDYCVEKSKDTSGFSCELDAAGWRRRPLPTPLPLNSVGILGQGQAAAPHSPARRATAPPPSSQRANQLWQDCRAPVRRLGPTSSPGSQVWRGGVEITHANDSFPLSTVLSAWRRTISVVAPRFGSKSERRGRRVERIGVCVHRTRSPSRLLS